MEDLRFQVECLESDLRKKDSLIKAVEAKMKEVSKKSSKVDVSKFSAWCDGVVGEKVFVSIIFLLNEIIQFSNGCDSPLCRLELWRNRFCYASMKKEEIPKNILHFHEQKHPKHNPKPIFSIIM